MAKTETKSKAKAKAPKVVSKTELAAIKAKEAKQLAKNAKKQSKDKAKEYLDSLHNKHLEETKSWTALNKFSNRADNAKEMDGYIKEINAICKVSSKQSGRYIPITKKQINKNLRDFAYIHQVNSVDDEYNIEEPKVHFSLKQALKMLANKAIYGKHDNEKLVAYIAKGKKDFLDRLEEKARVKAYYERLAKEDEARKVTEVMAAGVAEAEAVKATVVAGKEIPAFIK